jgi:predicted DNA-binding transcriptional regulator YafY
VLFKTKDAIDFEVEIAEGGIDVFYKEHYPSMTLHSENNKHYIRGFYNSGEENFIANYFMGYGTHILSAKPQTLKVHIKDHLMSLVKHFSEM